MKKLLTLICSITLILVLCPLGVKADTTATGATNDTYALMSAKAGLVTINVDVNQNADIYREVNDALILARDNATDEAPYKVVIPAGNYKVSQAFHVYSNTILYAEGATITFMDNAPRNNMIITGANEYNDTAACKGYSGFKNMAIVGGKWVNSDQNDASMFKAMHITNFAIKDATFAGGGGTHQLEICAIDNLLISGCTFCDFKGKEDATDKQESLQLDMPCAESVFSNAYQDGTTFKNVTITNNTFRDIPRGLGTHTQLLGAYHENIVITNNTFTNVKEECIVALDYFNCLIKGNTITNCGGGVLVQSLKTKNPESIYTTVEDGSYAKSEIKSDMQILVTENVMKIKYDKSCDEAEGIKIYGGFLSAPMKDANKKTIAAGDYRVKGVTATNNVITTAGYGIHLSDATDTLVNSNTMTGAGFNAGDPEKTEYDGIFVNSNCANIEITSNKITTPARHGIFIMNSSVANISGNTIDKAKKLGIGLNEASVTGTISSNKIKSPGTLGISLAGKSKVASIKSNTISKTKDKGIGLAEKAVVKGEVSKNYLESIGTLAISLSGKSSIGSVKGNTIIDVKDKAIGISETSEIKGAVSDNTIKKVGSLAISLSGKSSIGSIQKNKFSNIKDKTIGITGSSKIKGAIDSNKLTNVNSHAIILSDKSSAGSITNNELSKVKNTGINIYGSSTVKGAISGNKITDCNDTAIAVSTKSKAGSIEKNTITNAAKLGVNIYLNSTVTGVVANNNIDTTGSHGIIVSTNSNSGAVKGNTIANAGGEGLLVYKGSNVNGTVSNNTFKKIKLNAIAIKTKSTTKAVTGNKMTDVKSSGVLVYDKSKVKGDVSGNQYSKVKGDFAKETVNGKITGKVKANKKK